MLSHVLTLQLNYLAVTLSTFYFLLGLNLWKWDSLSTIVQNLTFETCHNYYCHCHVDECHILFKES